MLTSIQAYCPGLLCFAKACPARLAPARDWMQGGSCDAHRLHDKFVVLYPVQPLLLIFVDRDLVLFICHASQPVFGWAVLGGAQVFARRLYRICSTTNTEAAALRCTGVLSKRQPDIHNGLHVCLRNAHVEGVAEGLLVLMARQLSRHLAEVSYFEIAPPAWSAWGLAMLAIKYASCKQVPPWRWPGIKRVKAASLGSPLLTTSVMSTPLQLAINADEAMLAT